MVTATVVLPATTSVRIGTKSLLEYADYYDSINNFLCAQICRAASDSGAVAFKIARKKIVTKDRNSLHYVAMSVDFYHSDGANEFLREYANIIT